MNKVVRGLAIAATASVVLTGCAAQNPNDAATVAGVPVPERDVEVATSALTAATQGDPRQIRLPVANTAILGAVADNLARAHDVAITEASRRQLLQQVPQLSQIAQTEGGRLYVEDATKYVVVARRLGEDRFLSECSKLDVTVNPRYGTWIPESCQLSGSTGSLSQPVPTPMP